MKVLTRTEKDQLAALSRKHHLPSIDLAGYELERQVFSLLDKEFCLK